MTPITRLLVCLVVMGCVVAAPVLASSTAASSTSDSIGVSVGSSSASFGKSSDSSKHNDVAEGDYKVVEVAAVDDRPGTARLILSPVAGLAADDRVITLYLPRKAVDNGHVAVGDVVTAQHRDYGIRFAKTASREAFFLMLDDDWYRALQTRPVAL